MGARLQAIVDRVRTESKGLPNVDLARLNLKVGRPLSRQAAELPDDPTLVALAESIAREILSESGGRGGGRG
ncbi:hypothetical protein [Sandaracinus amylolyticus]|uniref:hypothetical protein n=1 Tax=Sandaracinus amylolyticus TaxID=927083 RepID=UPI001F295068|nr:hypothetical protein [Sandaracinus amylolyticus]UJR85793.1 Hypothetical protein I5071_78730 [Sandaracinus amylolyticus]